MPIPTSSLDLANALAVSATVRSALQPILFDSGYGYAIVTPSGGATLVATSSVDPANVVATILGGTPTVVPLTGGAVYLRSLGDPVPVVVVPGNLYARFYGTAPTGQGISTATLQLPKFRLALDRALAGVSDAKILCVGDSKTAGYRPAANPAIPSVGSYPSALVSRIALNLAPSADGLGIPPSALDSGMTDGRWTAGGGWTKGGFGAGNAASYTIPAASTGTLTYADNRVNADTFDVYYCAGAPGTSINGSFTVTATGGSTLTQDANQTPQGAAITVGTQTIYRLTVAAGSAATTNAVTITKSAASTGAIYIVGVEPSLSGARRVRVGNAGVGSTLSNSWANLNPNTYGGIPLIKAYAPDLTIFNLGTNDSFNAVPVATYVANLQPSIAAAQISGDVILFSDMPSTGANRVLFEPQYRDALLTLSASLNVPFVDVFGRFGNAPNAAYMDADLLHGNLAGYMDVAQALFSIVRAV